jgi:pimeloyl-ACP methyl ester carboxylesterase
MAEMVQQGDVAVTPTGASRAGQTSFCDIGQGQPIVFIHGVGLCKDVWEPQIAAFAASHRVIVYDMLGHGDSDLGPPDTGLDGYVAQLAQLLDNLAIDKADIVGHSMGALVALGFALAQPHRVRRLVALNAVYDRPADQRAAVMERAAEIDRVGPRSAADRAISRWFGEPLSAEPTQQIKRVKTWLENADPVGYARAYRIFASSDCVYVGRLSTLTMPVLYLTGELDLNSSPAMSRRMASETPGGKAVSLSGERHMMALVSPERVNTVLREFVTEGAA